jgi:CRP-like cAMP-binding protein
LGGEEMLFLSTEKFTTVITRKFTTFLNSRMMNEAHPEHARLVVNTRMAGILIQLVHEHGKPTEKGLLIPFSLTNQEIASLVAPPRETVNRTLSKFRRYNATTVNRQEICVNIIY